MMNDETPRLDVALRGHHQVSLQQLSPQVRAQLAQRRHATLRGKSPQPSHRLTYAVTGFAALFALALGVQFREPPPAYRSPVSDVASAAAVSTPANSLILDQDPDFYAWLASPDAMQVAVE